MGIKEPDVVQIMTHENEIGHFLGTVDLDSIQVGKRFQLNNIYYDFDKWAIRPEAANTLDKLAVFLKDNPGITVELGSHTDLSLIHIYINDEEKAIYNRYLSDIQGYGGNPDLFYEFMAGLLKRSLQVTPDVIEGREPIEN